MRMNPAIDVRRRAAVAGGASAALALGLTEVAAGLGEDVPSPVAAIGDVFIDGLPGWMVRAGIDQLGTGDKPFLVSVIVVVSVLLGAWLGTATLRRRWVGPLGFALAGLFGAWATVRDPLSSTLPSILATLVPAAVGAATLVALVGWARATEPTDASSPADRGLARRRFLFGAVGTGVAALSGTRSRRSATPSRCPT
jgi:hypothetical protein